MRHTPGLKTRPTYLRGEALPGAGHGAADLERRPEDLADPDVAGQRVTGYGFEARRCNAPAVRAVGIAPELARRDAPLEVRRQAMGRLRERAIVRRGGRSRVHVEHAVRHLNLRIPQTDLAQVRHHALSIGNRQP